MTLLDQYKYHPSPPEASTYNNVVKTNWQLLSECSKGDCKSTCKSNIKYRLFSIQYLNILEFLFLLFTWWRYREHPTITSLRISSIYLPIYISRRIRYANLWDTCNLDRSRRHLKFWPLFHIVDTNICSSFSTRKLEEPVVVALQPRLRVLFVSNGLVCVNALRATQATQNDGSRRTYTDGHILVCSQSWVQLTLTFIQHKACTSYKLPRTLTLRSCLSSISPTSPLADA